MEIAYDLMTTFWDLAGLVFLRIDFFRFLCSIWRSELGLGPSGEPVKTHIDLPSSVALENLGSCYIWAMKCWLISSCRATK